MVFESLWRIIIRQHLGWDTLEMVPKAFIPVLACCEDLKLEMARHGLVLGRACDHCPMLQEGEDFERAADAYVRPFLSRGIPSLFSDLKALYRWAAATHMRPVLLDRAWVCARCIFACKVGCTSSALHVPATALTGGVTPAQEPGKARGPTEADAAAAEEPGGHWGVPSASNGQQLPYCACATSKAMGALLPGTTLRQDRADR
jgi:hypothetical protein